MSTTPAPYLYPTTKQEASLLSGPETADGGRYLGERGKGEAGELSEAPKLVLVPL